MTEAIIKSVKVTFHEGGLPGGTHAIFKVGKEYWVAWPNSKHVAALTVTDRLIGALQHIRSECIMWINLWPSDAARVARVLEIIQKADRCAELGALDKVQAQTA